jgi:bla regulator protein blaR1
VPNTLFRAFGIALICRAVWAQTGGTPLAFEVASIKPSRPDDSGSVIQTTGGEGLIVTNASVRSLITFAYEIRDLQLSGGPGWLGTDRFNITAKTAPDDAAFGATKPDSMTDAQRKTYTDRVRERLRTLLAERFGLVVHHEPKDVAVLLLTVSKTGPRMKAAAHEAGARQGMRGTGRGHTQGYAVTMERLAIYLETVVGRPVLDRTAITGEFDWTLDWVPDSPASGGDNSATPQIGPTIFTAIQEQLGLKLEPGKAPIDSLVIDRMIHPTEN